MSERSTELLLLDIRLSIVKILDYYSAIRFELYEADAKTKNAVERNFEIIGEEASRVSEDFKKIHPSIEGSVINQFILGDEIALIYHP